MDSAPSTFGVEQKLRRDQVAEASCDGSERVHPAVKRKEGIEDAETVTAYIGAVEHTLNAEHPVLGELIVAADLSAADETATRKAAIIIAIESVGEVRRHLRPADVDADIAACPKIDRSRRRGRRLHGHVSRYR